MWAEIITPALVGTISQKIFRLALIIIGAAIAKKTTAVLVNKVRLVSQKLGKRALAQQQSRLKTIRSLIKNATGLVINFVAFVMLLSELGVDILPLLTGAGMLGLAVGFGAKSLVSDLIGGFFLILEGQVNVGDQIQVGSHQGKIIKISLRTVTLKDGEGKTYFIPNSSLGTLIKFPSEKAA